MKKAIKKPKKSIIEMIFTKELFFVLCLITLIYGLNVFWIGFHNIDLCHNEISIQNQLSKELRDINKEFILTEQKVFDGEIWSLKDCYLTGLKGIIQGLYVSIAGAFLVGYVK